MTPVCPFFNKHDCRDQNDNSTMSHLGVADFFSYFMEFEIWHVFLVWFLLFYRLRHGKFSRFSYFKQNAGGSLQVKIRGEGDGRSDSGPKLYGRGNHKENPLWLKHPSCSCYCKGKRSLTSSADVQPTSWTLLPRGRPKESRTHLQGDSRPSSSLLI